MIHINPYSYPPFVCGTLILLLGFFVYQKNKSSLLNRIFGLMCLGIFIWLISYAVFYSVNDEKTALIWMRIAYIGVIYIPITVYHVSTVFLVRLTKRNQFFIRAGYLLGLVLVLITYTDYFFAKPYKYYWGYYPHAGILYNLYMLYFVFYYGGGQLALFIAAFKNERNEIMSAHKKSQLKYFCSALAIALVAAIDFLPKYGIEIYPLGYLFMFGFTLIIAYAIVRHQLMDIEVVIRRTAVFAGLFVFVYGTFTIVTVIGQEFFRNNLGWNQWVAMIPTVIVITFALRPLENFLTNTTEKFLFQKKYDYRELLRVFTNEILTFLDLQRLTEKTVEGLSNIVKLESAAVLLYDKDAKVYKTVAGQNLRQKDVVLGEDHTLIHYLKVSHKPILRDKTVDKMEHEGDITQAFKALNARLCLPIISHDILVGVLSLGMKKSGEEYTSEEQDILMTLARTEAIAISNAQLFDELSKTQAEAAQREKMAVIGTLAAGINHEICNPLGIVRGQCEMFLLNARDGFYSDKSPKELIETAQEVMNKVIHETDRATAITKKLSSFAKPAKKHQFEKVAIAKELDEVMGLLEQDLKLNNIKFKRDFPSNYPAISADKKQIQEVLFNIIRNAAQAIDKKEGNITVSGISENGSAVVHIADNGMGIPKEKIDQIFHPFYTTKAPGKGTGLGLFIVKQVVERNSGTIAVQSEPGVGTTFILKFPAAMQETLSVGP